MLYPSDIKVGSIYWSTEDVGLRLQYYLIKIIAIDLEKGELTFVISNKDGSVNIAFGEHVRHFLDEFCAMLSPFVSNQDCRMYDKLYTILGV